MRAWLFGWELEPLRELTIMSSQQDKFVVSPGLPVLSDSASPRTTAVVGDADFEFLRGTQTHLEDYSIFYIAFGVYCLTSAFLCTLLNSTKLSDRLVKQLHK